MGFVEKLQKSVPCLMSRRFSFASMTILLSAFFFVEVIVGYITNSMALIADSFHMLSDVASLIVGYLALKYSSHEAPKEIYTYGYARAEVLGALVNAVFLVALCFSILIEALKRLVILEEIENPLLVFCVGAAGLVVNIFGMFLFHQTGHGHSHGGMSHSHSHGHGHSHGTDNSHGLGNEEGHGHSHGNGIGHGNSHGNENGEGHSHGNDKNKSPYPDETQEENKSTTNSASNTLENIEELNEGEQLNAVNGDEKRKVGVNEVDEQTKLSVKSHDQPRDVTEDEKQRAEEAGLDEMDEKTKLLSEKSGDQPHDHNVTIDSSILLEEAENKRFNKTSSAGQLNIRGVYLHILGDALGSVIVMISALIILYAHGDWTLYVDPVMSIIMVAIILKTSIPLLCETAKILMNSVPHHIQINELRERLMTQMPQIKNVHELHVWQLAGDKIIASCHVKFETPEDYDEIASNIKEFFHNEGIHSTTVQIEFENNEDDIGRRGQCMVVCSLDSACDDMMCCKPEK